jgi:shikimate kinase
MEKRRSLYESAADVTISTDKKTTVEIVKEILQK